MFPTRVGMSRTSVYYERHRIRVPHASGDEPGWLTIDRDTDGDGVLDSVDPDDDNDNHPDRSDAFPLDSSEWDDSDGDGEGDNADTDDDNDTIADGLDNCPLVANLDQLDSNDDGKGDACTDDSICFPIKTKAGGFVTICL